VRSFADLTPDDFAATRTADGQAWIAALPALLTDMIGAAAASPPRSPRPWPPHRGRARPGPRRHGLIEWPWQRFPANNDPVPANYFDERIAATYREKWPELYRPEVIEPTVRFLADLAVGGAALEFGIGTGRIAIPLSQHGIAVHGIDLSPDMIAQLRAERGAEPVGATVGDFATTRVDGTFRLVYLIRNTIANLTTQDAQVDCFRNAAAHLEPGGFFIIELYIPKLRRLPPGETVHPFAITPTHLAFEEYDVATQIAYSHHYWVEAGQLQTFSAPFRYAWPSELDLMARLAGLTLKERWADWTRAPFTGESRSHVSVWQKAG
jgi:SAM-dependent methyltransferase